MSFNLPFNIKNIANSNKDIDYDCEINKQELDDRLSTARLQLIRMYPFYATIALKMAYREREDIPTIATDGKSIMFNYHFINALDNKELIFVLSSLVMHVVLQTMTRRGKRDPELWKKASDYVINGILVRDNIGKFPEVGGLYDKKYEGRTADSVYHELEEEGNGGGGSGSGSSGGENFDCMVTATEGSSGETKTDANGNITIEMTEDQMKEMSDDARSAAMEAITNAKMSAGNIPGEIQRMVDDLLEPRVDWRSFLKETADGQVKNDYDRKRPNRRFPVHQFGVVLPSMSVEDHVKFSLAIDTSGSISPAMLTEFVSEVRGIVETFSSFEVDIWCFDTRVHNHQSFTEDTIDQMDHYEIMGGGGTDFMANWEYMKEIDHVPNTFIMMTDGYPWNSWGDADYCPAIFLIHDESAISNKIKAPFGDTLYFDDF